VGGIGNKCAQTIHPCKILYALFRYSKFQSALLLSIDPLFLYVELFPQLFVRPVVCPIFRARLLLGGSRDTLIMCPGFPFFVWSEARHGLETLSLPARLALVTYGFSPVGCGTNVLEETREQQTCLLNTLSYCLLVSNDSYLLADEKPSSHYFRAHRNGTLSAIPSS
jgi:hypothetical protein